MRSVSWIVFRSPVTVTGRRESARIPIGAVSIAVQGFERGTRSLFVRGVGLEFGLKRDVMPTGYYLLPSCNNLLATHFTA